MNIKKSSWYNSNTNILNKNSIDLCTFDSVVDLNDYKVNNNNETVLKKSINTSYRSNGSTDSYKTMKNSSSHGSIPINYYKINNIEAFINNLRKPVLKSNNKYSYKESKTYYCRVVGETVMIRIGGGWKDLNSFIYDRVSKILEYQNDLSIQNKEIVKKEKEKQEIPKEEKPIFLPINGVKSTMKYRDYNDTDNEQKK